VSCCCVFFLYWIGLDAVSTAAQEAKNSQKGMPIGLLITCMTLYASFSYVMMGLVPYTEFAGDSKPAATVLP
jgi:APA family basic amino acid/polyamine antiporter